jgi:hypothetical protein
VTTLLITLLASPLPHGQRCETCIAHEDGACLWAADLRRYSDGVRPDDGCVYWHPADGSGLDMGGVPLASPVSEE